MDLRDLKNNSTTMPVLSGSESLEDIYQILGKALVEAVKGPFEKITVRISYTDEDTMNNNENRPVIDMKFRYTVPGDANEKSFIINRPGEFFRDLRSKFEDWSKNTVKAFVFTVDSNHKFNLDIEYK